MPSQQPPEPSPLPAAVLAERFATQIVSRRLEVPALFFLELHRPFSTIFHTSALFAQPLMAPFIGADRIDGLLAFLEDRKNIDILIRAIEVERERQRHSANHKEG